jgi:hypothetical protein
MMKAHSSYKKGDYFMNLGKSKIRLFTRLFAVIALTLSIVSCNPSVSSSSSELTDTQILENFAKTFTLDVDLRNVTNDITLPTKGTNNITISWISSKPAILSNTGVLGEMVSVDTDVILTATLKLNEETKKVYFTATVKAPVLTCTASSIYEIANPGFEEGNLCGWTATGTAFQHSFVLDLENYWAGKYNKDGEYLFTSNDHEIEVGTLKSSNFVLGGSGWISFKLGAAKNYRQIYISIMEVGTDIEIARYGNLQFDDNIYTANMVQYIADLSAHLGKNLYVLVTDNAKSDWAWLSLDSVFVYYPTVNDLPEEATLAENIMPVDLDCSTVTAPSEYDIINGGFDLAKVCGWSITNNLFDDDSLLTTPVNWNGATSLPEGKYYLSNWSKESNTGSITSSKFKLGGSGYISFRMAGAKNPSQIYASILDENGNELYRFANHAIVSGLEPIFITYKADLSEHLGENLYVKFVDYATSDWGWLAIDSVVTYYPTTATLPANAVDAIDLLNYIPAGAMVENYSFETGDFTGWTATGDAFTHITDIVEVWDGDTYPIDGKYYFNTYKQGDAGQAGESGTGTLTSSMFTLQGSGYITFMLGGAKNPKTQYVSIFDENDKEIARYGNPQFSNNPKMYTYFADLRAYVSQKLYIKITDNQTSDWGIMLFDNFRTYYSTSEMVPTDATLAFNLLINEAPERALVENHSFETGDFTGWIATGDAFTLITDVAQSWGDTYYYPNGTYYFNSWKQGDAGQVGEGGTGTLTSSKFVLQGSGYVSFMLGGAKHTENMYVSFYNASDIEIARFGNKNFNNSPAMFTYVANLSSHLGEELYIKIVDNQTEDWGIFLFDDFKTYYKDIDELPANHVVATNMLIPDGSMVDNYSFETGNLDGWTATGDAFTLITDVAQSWGDTYYYPNGTYYFNSWKQGDAGQVGESGTGTLTSSKFVLQGEGYITFKLGGAKHTENMYISIYNEDNVEIGRYGNQLFNDSPEMFDYKVDLRDHLGETLYIKIVDNQTNDWGIMLFDNFITYHHTNNALLENAHLALNILE